MKVSRLQIFVLKSRNSNFVLIFTVMALFSCTNTEKSNFKKEIIERSSLTEYQEVQLNICFDCLIAADGFAFEEELNSHRLELEGWKIERLLRTSINPFPDIYKLDTIPESSYNAKMYLIFERKISDLQGFKQLVIYKLQWNSKSSDKSSYEIKEIENIFHLGEDHFGYTPQNYVHLNSDQFNLTKVNQIKGSDFRSAYFSVLKSFLLLSYSHLAETTKNTLVDDFYGYWHTVTEDELYLEEDWMYGFVRKEYVFWDFDHLPRGSLKPGVHAPLRFYLGRNLGHTPDKYEIQVSDLSFHLHWFVLKNAEY